VDTLDTLSNSFMESLGDELRQDKQVVLAVLGKTQRGRREGRGAFDFVGEELQADREIILAAVRYDEAVFQRLPEEFRLDKEIARAFLEDNGEDYWKRPQQLQSDKDLLIMAIGDANIAEYIPQEYLEDEDVAMAVLLAKQDLSFVPECFRRELNFVQIAVILPTFGLHWTLIRLVSLQL